MLINKHRSALLVALALAVLPLAAQAQRKSPLADAPAIRKRFELRPPASSWARAWDRQSTRTSITRFWSR